MSKKHKSAFLCISCLLFAAAFVFAIFAVQKGKEEVQMQQDNEALVEWYLGQEEEESTAPSVSANSSPYRVNTNRKIDGILYIDRIDLQLPIFSEVTDANMKQSVCRVSNTGEPGCNNYCLLGHKMSRYGVIFNRLHEVKTGDTVRVQTKDAEYVYVISDIQITKGLDYSIFEDVPGEKRITVFTCDYSVKNGRRILTGQLQKVVLYDETQI